MVLPSLLTSALAGAAVAFSKPYIVFIFTDDQDLHHGSFDSQTITQELLVKHGTVFDNHYATTSVCCPSRVSLMRGQLAHNTNNTDINAPGGGFPKFEKAGNNEDYLPYWLAKAGYTSEYVGKLFNGNSLLNYSPGPKGWDHIDVLLDPYINQFNTVVMSENGARPVWYRDFHQSDVIRIKSIARLENLLDAGDPFFLMIAPTSPHVEGLQGPPTPPSRYNDTFANVTAPRAPNFDPADRFQKKKPSWLRDLPRLSKNNTDDIDTLHRRRLQSLRGVDDIVQDVVRTLEERNAIHNTYIIFSTDQGYHLGTHRHAAGKCLPYLEDTNIPLVVRGPGVPADKRSSIPSTVTDFAPTFLEIAGLEREKYPVYFDGSSLLPSWREPESRELARPREAINVEFWASAYTEVPSAVGGDYGEYFPGLFLNNTYKTLRIVGEDYSWLYSHWCTHDTELYNTKDDPYELENLSESNSTAVRRVKSRLNALLLVTKSCKKDTCRDPWQVLQPPREARGDSGKISSLGDSLDPKYDDFFDGFPQVQIDECLTYQEPSNEFPFYPEGAQNGLGLAYRNSTDNFVETDPSPKVKLTGNAVPAGGVEQRHASLDELLKASRALTDEELEQDADAAAILRREG